MSRFNFSLVGDHHHLAPPRTEQLRAVGGGVFFLGRAYFYLKGEVRFPWSIPVWLLSGAGYDFLYWGVGLLPLSPLGRQTGNG